MPHHMSLYGHRDPIFRSRLTTPRKNSQRLWVPAGPTPTPFVNDTMTGTDGTTLTAHTGETGATWAKQTGSSGSGTIQSNRVFFAGSPGATESRYYASGTPPNADYQVNGSINVVSLLNFSEISVCGRMTTAAKTCYNVLLYYETTGSLQYVYIQKYVAGTKTDITNTTVTAFTVGSNHTFGLRMIGNQISALVDGAVVLGPITDSAITAAGQAGAAGANATSTTGPHLDSISAIAA